MNKKPILAGIGELLWDLLPSGKQLGGAPCNFAFHGMQAGCSSIVISAIGNDLPGAGDAFTAIFTAGILQQVPLKEVHRTATEIAAYVCTQKGATPKLSQPIFK